MTARSLAFVLPLILVISGCGGVYESKVTGVVSLDGAPVSRGTVAYHPVGGGPAAYSPIASDGSYAVRTGRELGLPSGEYNVTVTAHEAPAVSQAEGSGPPPPGKAITPPWYRTKETSGLTFNVERGSNKINLELTSQPPAGWNPRGR